MKLQLPKTFTKFLFIAMLFVGQLALGQTNIFTYGNSTATIPSGFVLTNNVTTNAVDRTTYLLVDAGSPGDYIVTPNYDLSSYTTATINVNVATFGSGTSRPMKIEFSTNGGTSWNATTYLTATPSNSSYITGGPIVIIQTFTATTKFRFSNNGTTGQGVRIQALKLDASGSAGPVVPTVTTTTVSSIATTSASSGGNVTADGGGTVNPRGVYFGTTAVPTTGTSDGTGTGIFTSSLTSLSLNTQYFYRAYATNSAGTGYGSEFNFYTLAATPGVLVVSNPLQTTLDVTVNATTENSNPSITEYAIQETGGQYVQGDGSLGATAVWQTAATWGTKTVTGLTTSTMYSFSAKARNGANVETSFGTSASGTTLAAQTVDYVVVQSPNTTQNILEGGSLTVYIRAYEPGLTTLTGEQSNLYGWVGYSSTNDNPSGMGWTWVAATFNVEVGNDDEYQATLTGLPIGTYYYAARFQIGTGAFVYGGSAGVWSSDNVTLNVAADVVDYVNVQFSGSSTLIQGNNKTVLAQVYEPGITPGAGAGAGIAAEIGYSTSNSTPDGTWTWTTATYNGEVGNNDEYKVDLGAGFAPGTYYFASRFIKTGSSTYVYGGSGGVWNSDNITLTVEADVVDFCNIQYPATGTITNGMSYDVYAQVYEATVTEAAGQGAGITTEIGYSTSDVAPDGTWTWVTASYHADGVGVDSNNDEYKATLSGLAAGTYYYASRFIKTGSTTYVYGGTNGSPWTTSGVLTVNGLGTPTATAGTLEEATSFTANWDAVTDATSYEIDVYEETTVVATDLFISEYIEGSSSNKYIEIYNGTGASVDLSDYELRLYANGTSTPTNANVLAGTLANGATMVYSNSSASAYGGTTTDDSAVNFNGDDAIALYKISTTSFVDVFGRIGNDPGTQWTGSGGYSTVDKTLVRKSGVVGGITVSPTGTGATAFTTLTTEWDLYNIDTVSNLGSHTFSGGTSTTYVVNAVNVGDVTSYEVTGLNPATAYHYVVRAVLGAVTSGNSNVIDVTTALGSCTWDGSAWSNITGPTDSISAIIAGAYDTTTYGGFTAKDVTVNSGSLTINSGDTVTIVGGLVNTLTAADVVVENNGNLIQEGSSNLNTGAITVLRNSSALIRQDYTLWSSPVAGQELQAFSPGTLSNRFYTYDTSGDLYVAVATPNATDFSAATGYLIRMPNVYPTTATVWGGSFAGVPNSGDYTYSMTDDGAGLRFNLVGNPYPSTLDAISFVTNTTNAANTTGALYFWRKTNNAASPSYCTWTTGGFVSNGEAQVVDPNDVVQTGQGFFVEASGNGTDLVFDNTMRVDDHGDQFFRTATTVERNRIWLNATGANGLFSQTMVGYMSDATNGFDAAIDGKYINDGAIALTSLIEATPYAIQGRSLPFDATDIVPMQFKATAAGNYSIALDHVDGLFSGSQDVYLRDAQTGVDHDLKSGAYTFTTEAGIFANRFSVVYTAALSVSNPTLDVNTIVIYKNENQSFTINSGAISMASVKVFDIRGRLLTTQSNINAAQTTLTAGQSNEVLLVQVTSVEGATVTKKVVR